MDRAAIAHVPVLDRIVEQDELVILALDDIVVVKILDTMDAKKVIWVMVTDNDDDFAVKAISVFLMVMPCKITQMENLVIGLNDSIPPLDHRLVHFLDRGERPIGQPDDILVAEVGASDEESVAHDLSNP